MDIASTTQAITSFAPLDVAVIAGLFGVLTFLIYSSGVYRASALALSLLITQQVISIAEKATGASTVIATFDTPQTHAILFAIVFVALFFIIQRLFFSFGGLFGGFMHAALASAAVVIILISIWVTSPTLTAVWTLSPIITTVFAPGFALYWIILALGLLAFVSA